MGHLMSLRPLGEALAAWEPGRATRADPLHAIRSLWGTLVGSDVAEHAAPLEIRGATLVVATKSSAWSQQLQFLGPAILGGVRTLPEARHVERLAFRTGAYRQAMAPASGRAPRRGPPARERGSAPGPAADAAEALERLRRRVTRLQRPGQPHCNACGAPSAGAGEPCAPCAGRLAAERNVAVKRLLFTAPWLGTAELREHAAASPAEIEIARRQLLQRWWLALERLRAARRKPTAHERQIASSYVLLQSRLPPERMSPAVIRNLLGPELETLLWGRAPETSKHDVR